MYNIVTELHPVRLGRCQVLPVLPVLGQMTQDRESTAIYLAFKLCQIKYPNG